MSSITLWTQRHRTAAFFSLTFIVSWWAWPLWALNVFPTPFFACGPLVAALIVIGVAEGRPGYSELGARMISWRVGWTWWLVALGMPLAVLALAATANAAFGDAPAPALRSMAWSSLAVIFALRFIDPLDGPLGEEPGWRGYALPRLVANRSPLSATAVLASSVTAWHLPLVAAGQLAPIALVATFAITFAYTWLFNHTNGSVLLTMVFHVTQGTISYAALGFTGVDAARMDWLITALWFAVALGLVVLDRSHWRTDPPAAITIGTLAPVD